MFDDTDPTHLSQDTGDSDRPNTSGDDEAGILDDERPKVPARGGTADEGLTANAPAREGSGQDVGESKSGVVGGGGDATFVEGLETVELFDGSREDGDKSGDDEAGILDDKTPNTEVPGREGSGQDVGESASGVVAGGGDATLFEGGETVELFDGSKEDGDKSGDSEAGQQSGFRTLAPSQGGNPPDDEKELSTLLHLEPTKAEDDSAGGLAPGH
jgi:hypothetical protein